MNEVKQGKANPIQKLLSELWNLITIWYKQSKRLAKKFNLLKDDLEEFIDNFEAHHSTATSIKNNLFKVRLTNSDKNKGKSAGYRIYYYLKVKESIYSQIELINAEWRGYLNLYSSITKR
jgi:mRNA-degrading endonuclease RelE of RelBE toxin-antitoxin system